MIAAVCQPLAARPRKIESAAALLVEMKRLGIELGGKALEALRIDVDPPGPEGLPRFKIFQVSLGHMGCLSGRRRHAVSGTGTELYMMTVIIRVII